MCKIDLLNESNKCNQINKFINNLCRLAILIFKFLCLVPFNMLERVVTQKFKNNFFLHGINKEKQP